MIQQGHAEVSQRADESSMKCSAAAEERGRRSQGNTYTQVLHGISGRPQLIQGGKKLEIAVVPPAAVLGAVD